MNARMKCRTCGQWNHDPILLRPVPCLCESDEEYEEKEEENEDDEAD